MLNTILPVFHFILKGKFVWEDTHRFLWVDCRKLPLLPDTPPDPCEKSWSQNHPVCKLHFSFLIWIHCSQSQYWCNAVAKENERIVYPDFGVTIGRSWVMPHHSEWSLLYSQVDLRPVCGRTNPDPEQPAKLLVWTTQTRTHTHIQTSLKSWCEPHPKLKWSILCEADTLR